MTTQQQPLILIVDDEDTLREILAERFQVFHYRTATAKSGNSAWSYLQNNTPDVVISDIRMPDGDGIELLSKIKNRDVFSPKVFLMTGFHENFSSVDILNEGADGFFPKPFDASSIREIVQKSLIAEVDRWSLKDRYLPTTKIEIAVKENNFKIGRDGFAFLNDKSLDIKAGDIVSFTVKSPLNLVGTGRIIWHHINDSGDRATGLEILYLNADSLERYLNKIRELRPLASIPSLYPAKSSVLSLRTKD